MSVRWHIEPSSNGYITGALSGQWLADMAPSAEVYRTSLVPIG
jgi:hypothetical protein